MTTDKSLLFYGSIYHQLFDRALADVRRTVVGLVDPGSSVLDIACGTGQLCRDLVEQRRCRVVGVDRSLRMLAFARRAAFSGEVDFLHRDATNLDGLADQSFDYATITFFLHEVPAATRARVLREALRVAPRVVIADSRVPLPWNLDGIAVRLVEATFGREHNRHFRSFLEQGGIGDVIERAGLPVTVRRRTVFRKGCREAVLVESVDQ